MALRVIGAGMGRTGTLSLKAALDLLGFGPCHHMNELFADPSTVRHWEDAWTGRPVDWDAAFAGYASAVDYPTWPCWEALAETYPDARVILTVRDPERWYDSTRQTTWQAYLDERERPRGDRPLPLTRRARQLARVLRGTARLWEVEFEDRFADRDYAIARFEQHNRSVVEALPPERLLVFAVKDGWGPLCDFLGVEPPDVPFPRSNDRKSFYDHLDTVASP